MRRGEFDPDGLPAQAAARYKFLQAIRECELEEPLSYGRPCRALTELRGEPLQRTQ